MSSCVRRTGAIDISAFIWHAVSMQIARVMDSIVYSDDQGRIVASHWQTITETVLCTTYIHFDSAFYQGRFFTRDF
jgi:hypothetical protein